MELRIFGPGSAPDQDFEKDLTTLFTIDAEGWDVLAGWLLTTISFNPDEALSSPAVVASTLVPEEFVGAVNAIKYLLEAWHMHRLSLEDIQRDLMVLGYSADQAQRLGALLLRVEPAKLAAYTAFMRFEHENAVLPTLEDIDVVCDVRPVFEDYVYPIPRGPGASHTKLLGFSYMVLMELVAEDFEGKSHKLSFQMTESVLADFRAALRSRKPTCDTY